MEYNLLCTILGDCVDSCTKCTANNSNHAHMFDCLILWYIHNSYRVKYTNHGAGLDSVHH